ncbi:terminase small subunit [Clostridium perfringens]|uniref:terminase small subunit n=1 Tax=Clostridium perfringens TaxID=1502 RepID=UPI002444B3D9|nr:terminase small subunit [Clostridium perfringens]MDG6892708.1 Terminase small subunit [Clostridium perfringens]MDU5882840.1 terminase small subunit [Clostridium perfringens]
MARARSPNRDKAFEIYKDHDGNITNREIADMLDENEKTISNWKCRDKWNVVLQKNECSTTNKKVQKNIDNNMNKEPIAEEVKEVLGNTELTDKQRLFCIYYIKRFNATKAYQKAYGCSYETALVNGPRLLGNARIQEEVQNLKEGKLNRIMLSEEDIFQKYMDIAFSDIGDYLSFKKVRKNKWTKNKEGENIPVVNPDTGQQDYFEYNVVELNNSKELDTSILQEVSEGKDGVKIKLQDKMKALQWLADHMGIATEEQRAKIKVLESKINKDGPSKNDMVQIVDDIDD